MGVLFWARSLIDTFIQILWFHLSVWTSEKSTRNVKGPHECEVLGTGLEAAESESAWRKCKKNPGHKKFIPVQEFMGNHQHRSIGDEERERLGVLIQLTVRIRLNWTSGDRPEDDDLAEYRGSNRLRLGTGFIWYVSDPPRIEEPCPCFECDGKKVRKYWVFLVRTAHHVVYNTEEARAAQVDLFYDDEGGQKETVWALKASWSRPDGDVCSLECLTCDERLARKITSLNLRRLSVPDTYDKSSSKPKQSGLLNRFTKIFTRERHEHALIVSHPHGQPKRITVGKWRRDVEKKGDERYVEYNTATCPGSSGAPVFLLYPDPQGNRLVLRHTLWGFVHGGTHRPSSFFTDSINYGNF